MPFAGYADFDACVIDQTRKGHSDESAHKICGRLQADLERGFKMNTSQLSAQIGAYDPATRSVPILASTTNEVEGVALKKWDLSRFQKNPVILWAHDASKLPVGLARNVEFSKENGLTMRVVFGSALANPLAEQLAQCVHEGLVRAVSVGYTEDGDTNILDEVSFVSIGLDEDAGTGHIAQSHPANANVITRSIAMNPSDEQLRKQHEKDYGYGNGEMIGGITEDAPDSEEEDDEDEEDEDAEEDGEDEPYEFERSLSNAARTLDYVRKRFIQARLYGGCNHADALERFNREVRTIRVVDPNLLPVDLDEVTRCDARTPEEKAAAKIETTMAKKESAARVKTLDRAAELASMKAGRSNAPEDHKAAALANRDAAKAEEQHYFGFRNSSKVNQDLHGSKQFHNAMAGYHEEGRTPPHIAEAIKRNPVGSDVDRFGKPVTRPDVTNADREKVAQKATKAAREATAKVSPTAGDVDRNYHHGQAAIAHDAAAKAWGKVEGPGADAMIAAHGKQADVHRAASTGASGATAGADAIHAAAAKVAAAHANEFKNEPYAANMSPRDRNEAASYAANRNGYAASDKAQDAAAAKGGGGHGHAEGQSRDDHGRWDGSDDGHEHYIAGMKAMNDALDTPGTADHAAQRADHNARAADHFEKAAAEGHWFATDGSQAKKAHESASANYRDAAEHAAASGDRVRSIEYTGKAGTHEHAAANQPARVEAEVKNPFDGTPSKYGDVSKISKEEGQRRLAAWKNEGLGSVRPIEPGLSLPRTPPKYELPKDIPQAAAVSKPESPPTHPLVKAIESVMHAVGIPTRETPSSDFAHLANRSAGGGRESQSRGADGRWDGELHLDDNGDLHHFDFMALDLQGRFDGKLERLTRTQLGGATVPARLSRTGVLKYRNPDGSTRRELRLAAEIFKADSLKTLEHAPVIDIIHHTRMVTPETFREVNLGHAVNIRQEGNYIVGDLMIQDQGTLDAIERGERTEISCGYRCTLDMTPGVYEGEPYDCVQRDIRYNHAALCPPNRGRAGPEVGLRL